MSMEIFQSQIDSQVKELGVLQKEYTKMADSRQKLIEQQHESELVKKEIDLLDNSAKVYKLMGPALVRQDTKECKSTIDKRLEFIRGELKKVELFLQESEKKQMNARQKIQEIQTKFQTMIKDMQMAMQNQKK